MPGLLDKTTIHPAIEPMELHHSTLYSVGLDRQGAFDPWQHDCGGRSSNTIGSLCTIQRRQGEPLWLKRSALMARTRC